MKIRSIVLAVVIYRIGTTRSRGAAKTSRAGATNVLSAALLSLVLAVPLLLALGSAAWAGTPTESEARAKLGRVEIPFIANEGQVDERVAYYAMTFAGTVFVTTKGELVYSLPGPARDGGDQNSLAEIREGAQRSQTGAAQREPGWTLVERFAGGKVQARATERAPTNVSYFVGNDPARWRSEVASFGNVELGEVWPGVEVQLRAQGSNVEKIYRVRPGARAQQIWMQVAGAHGLELGEDGALLVRTGHGVVSMRRPVAYQEQEEGRLAVAVAYRVRGSGYGFALAAYDPRYPVVIDPLLQATYLGGSDEDDVNALAVTGSEVFVAGVTKSTNFPGTAGGVQGTKSGIRDAFVARLDLSLTSLSQATYLGGSDEEYGSALAVTGSEVFVAGLTKSPNFPGTAGGAQASYGGGDEDAFIARLNLSLTSLSQATYLGGGDVENARALAVTGSEVFVAGATRSTNFPGTAGGAQASYGGGTLADAFVARLNLSLTSLSQATYLGGSDEDGDLALAVTGSEVFVAGVTKSTNFPGTAGGAQASNGGDDDGFVARLNLSLTSLSQATYLGGSGEDDVLALAVTGSEVFVAGEIASTNFPGTAGGAQASYGGGPYDAYVARLNLSLTSLSQATYLGGSDADRIFGLVVTGSEVFVAGQTGSTNFPATAGGAQASYGGGLSDAFVARLNLSLTSLSQATYLGGSGPNDNALAAAVMGSEVFVAGYTDSTDFPATAGGAQASDGGIRDAFVARLSADLAAQPPGAVCGNGIVESGEQCDDGNTQNGDCCSSTCQFESASSPCTDDGNVCTDDLCNGSGVCLHPQNSSQSCCVRVYVGNESSNDVSVIEAPTNTVVATVPGIQHADVGAITPNGAYVYVASGSPPNVFVIDTATNAVVATIPIAGPADTGANDVAVTPDGTKAYAPNATEVPGSVPGKTVSVIDTATNALVETVTVGNGAASVAITPDGAYAYVTNYADHTVSVLATATNTVVATVPIPGCAPWPPTQCANDIAITPNGAFAYVTNLDVNNVSVIDTATNTVVATIPVGIHPDGIAITPDGAFAYVANESSATVSVIDLATNSVSATISVVGMPVFVAVSPDGGAAYVSSFVSNVVSVIDTLTNTVTATVPVGSNPGRLAVASVPGACSVAGCGNGTIGPGEECDDGNTEGGDCCSSSCQFESSAVQCRPSVGACDPAEFCTGTAGTCPPDANPTCTPTPTPIPNPCAAGADTDGDGVANACDNCPDDFNPAQSDGNGNGAGDVCDGTSSALVLKRVQLKAASANKSNASIRIRALLDAADFGALDAALAGGLVVAVSGAGLTGNEVMTFPVPRCIALTSSRISCIGSNGETATFVKHRKGSLFNVRITAKSRTFLPPLSPTGVQVVFSAGGLDRADKIPSCKVPASGRSANCRK